MGKITCAWIVLLAVSCGQGPDALDSAMDPGNKGTRAAPLLATRGPVGTPAPKATDLASFCSNDALPAGGRNHPLAAESTSESEPDPFYRAPQDKDAWRRVAQSSTLAQEIVDRADDNEPGSTDER